MLPRLLVEMRLSSLSSGTVPIKPIIWLFASIVIVEGARGLGVVRTPSALMPVDYCVITLTFIPLAIGRRLASRFVVAPGRDEDLSEIRRPLFTLYSHAGRAGKA
jgi:hypothetical protein